jgi:hypothetical protein
MVATFHLILTCLLLPSVVLISESSAHMNRGNPIQSNINPLHSTFSDTIPVDPAQAPGTAEVRVAITEIVTENDRRELVIKVKKTLSYGSSTPPLASGETLRIDCTTFTRNAADRFEAIKKGMEVDLLIGHVRPMQQGEEDEAPVWRLQEILTDLSQK